MEVKPVIEKLLTFPIPDTFLFHGSQSYSLVTVKGRIETNEDLSPDSVLESFDLQDLTQPVAVRKRVDYTSENRTSSTAVSASLLPAILRKVSELEELICIQVFVKLSKPTVKPRIVRVCFSPSGSKPFGYVIANTVNPGTMAEVSESMTAQFCASTDSTPPSHLSVYRVAGKTIEEPVRIAEQVFHFIENFFTLRLNQVVVDVVPVGVGDTYKLIQVKSFTVKPFVSPLRQLALAGEKYTRRGSVTTTANAVWHYEVPKLNGETALGRKPTCFLCKLKKPDLSKLVTLKMVNECLTHLHARLGRVLMPPRGAEREGFYRCCDICYSLIVNEQELIKVAKKLKKIISPSSTQDPPDVTSNEPVLFHWRLLLAVHDFADTPDDISELTNLKVSVAIAGQELTLPVFQDKISGFRIFNMATPHDVVGSDIGSVDVRVVSGGDRIVGSGSVSILDRLASQARFAKSSIGSINCFLGKAKWSVPLTLGIARDGEGQAGVAGAACRPLPDAWMDCLVKLRRARRARARSRSQSVGR